MLIEIENKSDHWLEMYSLKVYNASEKEQKVIHDWIVENIESYDEPRPGCWYLFEHEEDAAACKLRWS